MAARVTADALIHGVRSFATLPQIQERLKEVLNTPGAPTKELGRIIAYDPNLTALLLKLVNSAFYSINRKVDNVSEAVVLLGTVELKELIESTEVVSTFDKVPSCPINMEEFWKHSMAVGLFSREIATRMRLPNADGFFVCGLLHDIGQLILLLNRPAMVAKTIEHCDKTDDLFHKAETQVIGVNHSQVGAALVRAWKLPDNIQNTIAYHHQPWIASTNKTEVAIVHVADIIAHGLVWGKSLERFVPPLETAAWDQLGLPESTVTGVIRNVEPQFKRMVNSILKK